MSFEIHNLQAETKSWGWPGFGLVRFRIYILPDNKDHKTLWHVTLWRLSFGMSFPAFLVNAITRNK